MTEERITETETESADGTRHTRTTVVHDAPAGGGSKSWIVLLVALAVVVAAIVLFTRVGDAEIAKDNAVADAANEVGEAAGQVGDAVQDVADEVTDGD